LYFRVILEDALFINKHFLYFLKKTKSYLYVDIFKKDLIFLTNKLFLKNKNILVTKQIKDGDLTYRVIDKLYIINSFN
jgi:hypothetical protein